MPSFLCTEGAIHDAIISWRSQFIKRMRQMQNKLPQSQPTVATAPSEREQIIPPSLREVASSKTKTEGVSNAPQVNS